MIEFDILAVSQIDKVISEVSNQGFSCSGLILAVFKSPGHKKANFAWHFPRLSRLTFVLFTQN